MGASAVKQEKDANVKKEEHAEVSEDTSKRKSCHIAGDGQEGQLHKVTKKEKKKLKKEKKQRKAEKKLRRAERRLRRLQKREHAAALSIERQRSRSASSSSEGSS